ncbi:MAG TPA: hypothetical protein VKU41_07830 [Polyangiaceae bacterium]|nr:hypothetical protein [Polyangiaceae bacterium]
MALAIGTASASIASTFACGGADTPAIRATRAGDAGSSGTSTVDADSEGADSSMGGSPPPSGGSGGAAGSHGSSSGASTSADAGAETSASGSGAATTPGPGGAVGDASTTVDAGPRAIVCGHLACDPHTQVCCLADRGPLSCTATSACIGQALVCSGSESCQAGDVCCGKAADGGALDIACAPTCGPSDTRICSADADCPNGRCQSRGSGYGSCISRLQHDAGSD